MLIINEWIIVFVFFSCGEFFIILLIDEILIILKVFLWFIIKFLLKNKDFFIKEDLIYYLGCCFKILEFNIVYIFFLYFIRIICYVLLFGMEM